MSGIAGADHIIVSGRRVAAGMSRNDLVDARNLLEHGFHAPEAASRENGRLISLEKVPDNILVVYRRIGKACRM